MYILLHLFFNKGRCVSYHVDTVQISEGKENCNQCFSQTAKLHKIAFQSSNSMAVMPNLVCFERIRSIKILTPLWRKIPRYWGEFFAQLWNLQLTVSSGWIFLILALGLLSLEISLSFSVVCLVWDFCLFVLPIFKEK